MHCSQAWGGADRPCSGFGDAVGVEVRATDIVAVFADALPTSLIATAED